MNLFFITWTFNLKAQLTADFSADITKGCGSLLVHFKDLSTGNPTNYLWNFGNGSTSSATNPTVSYDHPGVYTVSLTVSNNGGRDDMVKTNYINVAVSPIARFNYSSETGCVPLNAAFRDSSDAVSGTLNSWLWDFGDGSPSSGLQDPVHTYTNSGIYTVTLIAGNSNGCYDTISAPGAIVTGTKPSASFYAKQTISCASDPVSFVNTSTGTVTSYSWQFGDGDTTDKESPRHFFTDTGYIDVTLIATYNGCSDTSSKPKYIYIKPPYIKMRVAMNCDSPYVRNFQMKFLGTKNFIWDFGDGTTDALNRSPRHAYASTGTYLVKVTGFGTDCKFTDSLAVNIIDEKPSFSISSRRSEICKYDTVRFNAVNYNALNISSFEWDFNDGTNNGFSSAAIVDHIYYKAAAYSPFLVTVDRNGCYDTAKATAQLNIFGPVAGFGTSSFACVNSLNIFTDESVSDGKNILSKWIWDYGDGIVETLTAPPFTHIYKTIDTFTVKMKVVDANGCYDSVTKINALTTLLKPVAVFETFDTVSCFMDSIYFVNLSVGQVLGNTWNFGDGNTSLESDPIHVYSQPGTYNVRLVTGNQGCFDTAHQGVKVIPSPNIDAGRDTFTCLGSPLTLQAKGGISYSWSNDPALSCFNCPDPVANPLIDSRFYVIGYDNSGCAATDSIFVQVVQPVTVLVTPAFDTVCSGGSTQLSAAGADKYSWLPASGLSNAFIGNPVAKPQSNTTYIVTGTDNKNCFTDTASVTVFVVPFPTFNILDSLVTVAAGSYFVIKTNNSPDITNWQWSPSTDLSCTNCPEPTAKANKIIQYTGVATNKYGCSVSDKITIRGLCDGNSIFIPNTFSPNGDHVNDVFYPRGNGLYVIRSMRIFNRIGQLLFQKINFAADTESEGWDGLYQSKPVPSGVYLYFIEIMCNNGKTMTYKGDVMVL